MTGVDRSIKAAVIVAAGALRVDRGTLAALIAAHGARDATVTHLPWAHYLTAVRAALHPAGAVYAGASDDQRAMITEHTGLVPTTTDGTGWAHHRADLIVASTQAAMLAVAAQLALRRVDPWTAAGVLNRCAGLNQPQAVAVAAFQPPPAMPTARAEHAADQIAARYLTGRADMVAGNETRAAMVSGAVDAWSNHLPAGQYELVWSGGTCDVCADMDGKRVPLEEGFPVPCPAHPYCGCSIDLEEAQTAAEAA